MSIDVEGAARWTNAMPTVAGRVGLGRLYSTVLYSYGLAGRVAAKA